MFEHGYGASRDRNGGVCNFAASRASRAPCFPPIREAMDFRDWGLSCRIIGLRQVCACVVRCGWKCPPPPHDAADAGDAAAGFDFGDDARMAAEFTPILGGAAPAGQRGH